MDPRAGTEKTNGKDMSSHPFVKRVLRRILECDFDQGCHREHRHSSEDISWHSNPLPRHAIRRLLALTLLLVTAACGPSRPIPPVRAPSASDVRTSDFDEDQTLRLTRLQDVLAEPAPAELSSGLLVRLAFDDVGDLDLFVTDPQQESVYFANSPTRSGGRLVDDRRCDDSSPRVEAVHFPEPMAGRYRVGVDFHGPCDETVVSGEARKQGLYVVRVDVDGRILERRGMVTPGHFEVIVIEFDIEGPERP
jgi:hypothetical protein